MMWTSLGIAVGAFFGLLIGMYFNSQAYGLMIGAGIGLFSGLMMDKRKST